MQTAGSGATTEYATYAFTPGSIASGEIAGVDIEQDRDILAKSDAMSMDAHYVYHPIGAKYGAATVNPDRTVLETASNWSKVFETKNLGIVRITNVSNQDWGN